MKVKFLVKANTFSSLFTETDNQLQIHTPKLPTAGLSPPSATSDLSSSAKKTSAKKRCTPETPGIHILCRIRGSTFFTLCPI
jgi:hypothetical protein